MKKQIFERRIDLPVDSSELYAWHARPGAFQRLSPPWENVEMTTPAARTVPGAVQEMTVRVGPFRKRWMAQITEVIEGERFRDEQIEGPFASWKHTHAMESCGPGASTLIDHIDYAVPFGALGRAVAGRMVRRRLETMFAYRHRVTADDLDRHAATRDAEPLDILVTGASGMVGSALVAFLTTGGHRVRRLVRRTPRSGDEFSWDPERGEIDARAVEGADAVIHLAGENIAARRWSRRQKERIRRSRVEGTKLVANAIRAAVNRPEVLVSASAVGWYGERGDEVLSENSAAGEGFLADVSKAWEREASAIDGVRSVQLRFGVILGPSGGALRRMLLPFRMGAGGRIGSGRQWMSWISLDDCVAAIHHALTTSDLDGPVNVVAPTPVTNSEFTRVLASVLRRPAIAPLPAFVARVAFGELADALLLGSLRVVPDRLRESGFRFAYPDLECALRHLLGRPKSSSAPIAKSTAALARSEAVRRS